MGARDGRGHPGPRHRPLAPGRRADARLGRLGRLIEVAAGTRRAAAPRHAAAGQTYQGRQNAATPSAIRVSADPSAGKSRISLERSGATTGRAIDAPSDDQIRWLSAYWSK